MFISLQVTPAFTSALGVSSKEVGMYVASDMDLGDAMPFSAARIVAVAQIVPHPDLIVRAESGPPSRPNKLYDPFPRQLRSMKDAKMKEDMYKDFFPASPDAKRAWFITRLL